MERYEFSDGKSNKFWQIEQQGAELHIAWGKIGTNGQSQVKDFDSETKAHVAKAKLIAEKTGKGYAAAGQAPMAAGATPKVAKVAQPAPHAAVAQPASTSTPVHSQTKPQADQQGHEQARAARAHATQAAERPESPETAESGIANTANTASLTAASDSTAAPSGLNAADPEAINAALAARRAAPSFDEAALRAWPQVLQALADGEFDNTSAKSFTPSRVKKRFALDENAWQVVKARFEAAHLGSDYGYTTSLYLSANVQQEAAKLLDPWGQLGEAEPSSHAMLRAQLDSAWAPLHAGEPDNAVDQRFGQTLLPRESALPRRDAPGTPPQRMPFAQAWRELRRQSIQPFDTASCAPDYQPRLLALGQRIGQTEVTAPDPLADQALLDAALLMRNNARMAGDPDLIAAYLVDAYGLPEVLPGEGEGRGQVGLPLRA